MDGISSPAITIAFEIWVVTLASTSDATGAKDQSGGGRTLALSPGGLRRGGARNFCSSGE